MSSFTNPVSNTQISIKPRRWRIDGGFRYYIGEEGSNKWIDILDGFICDGGSLPRCVWWIDAPMGDGAAAYVIHDAGYGAHLLPRAECDLILLEGLEVLGMGWSRRRIIYNQVWMWGWKAYNSKTPESIIEMRQYVRTSFEPLVIKT